MEIPTQITYRHTAPSEAVKRFVSEQAAELEHFFERVLGCHVIVDRASRHHRAGVARFLIRLEVRVPGELLVVARESHPTVTHADAVTALGEAFHLMRRQLLDLAQRRRAQPEREAPRTSSSG